MSEEPDTDEDEENSLLPDVKMNLEFDIPVMALIAVAVIYRFAMNSWAILPPGEHLLAISISSLYLLGTVMMVFATVDGFDWERWSKWLAIATIISIGTTLLLIYFSPIYQGDFGTDAQLFSAFSAELVLQGKNPFVHSMQPAIDGYFNYDAPMPTPKVDGTTVTSFSYPAGAFLFFVPEMAMGWTPTVPVTPWLFATGTAIAAVWIAPPEWAPVAVILTVFPQNHIDIATAGIFDIFWVAPVIGCAIAWYYERSLTAGILLGVASTVKQQPWFIIPFLGYWALTRGRSTTIRFVGGLVGAFTAINLPYIIWNPSAWVSSVFTPIQGGAPLVSQGGGLALWVMNHTAPISQSYTIGIFITTGVAAGALYVLWFDRLKWTAFVVPPFLLWFHYRSLDNYFIMFPIVAFVVTVLAYDRVEPMGVSEDALAA